ncbi:uncharacterized protein [Medicago truncatula]|uniref:uncharacterized protein n=1 Tax=Medicago truncatula TaxID=3880 RepID=UPI000D2F4488|nr:uncharacterized protein LOC112417296 [Medicago truncatula]
MKGMSFPVLSRKWIRECVGIVTASVLVNGSPTDEFHLHRDLRQGDPLSPFLFLLTAEGLNILMKAMVDNHLFNGYSVVVSHLQFADDTLLLGHKSWANVRALRATLLLFESMSGLKVNFNKSLLVGINISDSCLSDAASMLCCKVGTVPFMYLGLPIGGNPQRLSFWDSMDVRDKQGLWYHVLVARYGEVGGRLEVGGRSGSSWWQEVGRIRDGDGDMGDKWFNKWVWIPDPVGGYTVRGAYDLLTNSVTPSMNTPLELVWHHQVPLKVSIFAWRLIHDRLPMKDNLAIHGVIPTSASYFVSRCGR